MAALSTVTTALERTWTAIRTIHPDVRPAALVVYLHPAGDRRGHYGESSWTTRDNGHLDEIHISAHILHEGARSVLQTLLHEACHSIATAKGVQEVSRQGRYHNSVFACLAETLGLVVVPAPGIGCATPAITDATASVFSNALQELDDALGLWRDLHPKATTTKRKPTGMIKLECPVCHRIIRATEKTLLAGTIECTPCKAYFARSHPL
jgi:hypothetical protein